MKKLKEFAKKLNGRQYLNELTKEDEAYARENGIVVVYGQSDDLMEVRGAIDEEFCCYDGGTFYLGFAKVEAIWCPKGTDYSWGYETDFPHEEFTIMEDNEHYCSGIVFYLKDTKPKQTNFDKITSSVESLAEFLVEESRFEANYTDQYLYFAYGEAYTTTDKNEAIKSTIKWLKEEDKNG